MPTAFEFRGHRVILSHGSAADMNEGWLRALRSSEWATTEQGVAIARFLDLASSGIPGLCGFEVDEPPFASVEARRILSVLVERSALEAFDVMWGRRGHPSLDFLQDAELSVKAWWMTRHELVHELVRSSLNDAIPVFRLPCDERARAALDAMHAEHFIRWKYEFTGGERRDLRADVELSLRRKFCRLASSVPEFFEPERLVSAHYELADLEERLGLFADAAATTRAAAKMEQDADAKAIAIEIVKMRADAARRR